MSFWLTKGFTGALYIHLKALYFHLKSRQIWPTAETRQHSGTLLPFSFLIYCQLAPDVNTSFTNPEVYNTVLTATRYQLGCPAWSHFCKTYKKSLEEIWSNNKTLTVKLWMVLFLFLVIHIWSFFKLVNFWLCWVFIAFAGAFSSCSERGLLLVVMWELLIAVTLVAENRL